MCMPGLDNLRNKNKTTHAHKKKIQERETREWLLLLLLFSKKACWKTAQSRSGSQEPTISPLSLDLPLALSPLLPWRAKETKGPEREEGDLCPRAGGRGARKGPIALCYLP